jgi:hypothetical protein
MHEGLDEEPLVWLPQTLVTFGQAAISERNQKLILNVGGSNYKYKIGVPRIS